MKNLFFLFFIGALLSGCASIEFYSEEEPSALKYYNPHPYILVTNPASDSSSTVSVVYLPDLKNPVYVKSKSGLGTAKLELSLENGMLTSFGNEVDSKLPETFEIASSVLGANLQGFASNDEKEVLPFDLYKLNQNDSTGLVLQKIHLKE